MSLEKTFEPQRRKERKIKTMSYPRTTLHPTGEWKTSFMYLFSLRLRAFAVIELRFLG